jgi:PAS domain S-box-containing protein
VTREPVITGPLDLEQGGLGMTAQQAIYQGHQVWGVARVVLEIPLLLAEANLTTGAPDLDLALRRSSGAVFFGPPDIFTADPVVERIDLVEGGWELAAIPRGGWSAAIRERLLLFQGFGLLIVGLVTSLVYLTVNRQMRLARAVQQRTADLAHVNTVLQQENAERQQAEETLRERASLLDLTHDTVFVRDMHDVITYWNRGAAELYGWTSTEAIGRVTHQLTRTIFPAPLEAINEELLRTGRWEGELIHTRRDGTQLVVASRWALQLDEWGNAIAILETNNNITERKQAEEALRRERDLVAHIMDTSPASIMVVNRDGQISFANARAEQVLGLSRDQITQRRYNDPAWRISDYHGNAFPDEDLPLRHVLRTGQPVYDIRYAIERPDGQRVLLAINAAPLLDEAGQMGWSRRWMTSQGECARRKNCANTASSSRSWWPSAPASCPPCWRPPTLSPPPWSYSRCCAWCSTSSSCWCTTAARQSSPWRARIWSCSATVDRSRLSSWPMCACLRRKRSAIKRFIAVAIR